MFYRTVALNLLHPEKQPNLEVTPACRRPGAFGKTPDKETIPLLLHRRDLVLLMFGLTVTNVCLDLQLLQPAVPFSDGWHVSCLLGAEQDTQLIRQETSCCCWAAAAFPGPASGCRALSSSMCRSSGL